MRRRVYEEDEVKRIRRVREEMHARFKTLDAFFAYVKTFEKKHSRPCDAAVHRRLASTKEAKRSLARARKRR